MQVVLYLRMCLAQNAGLPPTPHLAEMQDQAPTVATYVTQLLTQFPGDSSPISSYVNMLRQLLTAISGNLLPSCCCLCTVPLARVQ